MSSDASAVVKSIDTRGVDGEGDENAQPVRLEVETVSKVMVSTSSSSNEDARMLEACVVSPHYIHDPS